MVLFYQIAPVDPGPVTQPGSPPQVTSYDTTTPLNYQSNPASNNGVTCTQSDSSMVLSNEHIDKSGSDKNSWCSC